MDAVFVEVSEFIHKIHRDISIVDAHQEDRERCVYQIVELDARLCVHLLA